MTTQEVASKLIGFCVKGEFEKAQKELYADDAVSIEQNASPVFEKVTTGLPAVNEKIKKFMSMVEQVFEVTISDPLISGNSFTFVMEMDVIMKGRDREKMSEVCVYTVKDGKINLEQFFM